jgi:hypothetical protein
MLEALAVVVVAVVVVVELQEALLHIHSPR